MFVAVPESIGHTKNPTLFHHQDGFAEVAGYDIVPRIGALGTGIREEKSRVDGKSSLTTTLVAVPGTKLAVPGSVTMPNLDGLSLLSSLREDPSTRAIPFILLTARGSTDDLERGLGLGADDYLANPFDMGELLARVHSKIERPPVPSEQLPRDRQTGLLSERAFWQEAEQELVRYQAGGRLGALAYLNLTEPPSLREGLDTSQGRGQLAKQVLELIEGAKRPLDLVGRDPRRAPHPASTRDKTPGSRAMVAGSPKEDHKP
jgi:DNA-binding NarL/FixJ family response regulator